MLMRLIPKPRNLPDSGAFTPPPTIWGYIRHMSGWHQVACCLLALMIAGVTVVPVDLQRRIVDDAIKTGNVRLFVWLGGIYCASLVLHKILKFVLSVYQNWISESTVLHSRRQIFELYGHRVETHTDGSSSGAVVSIIGPETDKIGEFTGNALSEAAVNIATLTGITGYMLYVDYRIALLGLMLIVPQVILTPIIQRRLNKLIRKNVSLLRKLGGDVSEIAGGGRPSRDRRWRAIYQNRMVQSLLRNGMKALLNLMNALAPLVVLLFGGYMVIQGQTTLGVVLAFMSGFDRIAEPVRNLITFYRDAQQANVQYHMIASWMVRPAKIRTSPGQEAP